MSRTATAKPARYTDGMARYNRVGKMPNAFISILFILLALIAFLPLIFVFIISVSSETSIAQHGYSFWPSEFSTSAYQELWKSRDYIGRAFLNSVGITVVGTALGLILMGTMGYAMSRRTFYLRGVYTWIVFIPMLFGGGLVATYMINTQVYHLKDSYFALLLPGAVSSWWVIIMRTFFQTTVPDSIIESGKMDGASQLRIFAQLVIPISLPVLATIGLFLTFAYWNAWYGAMLYITTNHKELYPLQYVLMSIERNVDFLARREEYSSATGGLMENIPTETIRMAIVILIVLPIACSYPFFQRYFVGGLTIGSVKG
ncbi:MAG: carbohydrate ABC transporter permease [Oscillospiraceae bacterium]|nr:carbohydrate ABC transporter permease [Oscillospiraceae bacterium]